MQVSVRTEGKENEVSQVTVTHTALTSLLIKLRSAGARLHFAAVICRPAGGDRGAGPCSSHLLPRFGATSYSRRSWA